MQPHSRHVGLLLSALILCLFLALLLLPSRLMQLMLALSPALLSQCLPRVLLLFPGAPSTLSVSPPRLFRQTTNGIFEAFDLAWRNFGPIAVVLATGFIWSVAPTLYLPFVPSTLSVPLASLSKQSINGRIDSVQVRLFCHLVRRNFGTIAVTSVATVLATLLVTNRYTRSSSPLSLPSDPSLYKAYLCRVLNIKSTDVIDLTGHIDRHRFIAAGGSGEVWEGSWIQVGFRTLIRTRTALPIVVVKLVRLPPIKDRVNKGRRYKRMKRELELWSKLNHPYILPLVGIACIEGDANLPALISPLMENGNIIEFLQENPSYTASKFLKEIIKGLHYLHTFDPVIVHGDLKGANVLINHRKEACLADFGLSRFVVDNSLWRTTATQASGTPRWMAPELIEGSTIIPTIATDIYGFGMTCYEILSMEPPFVFANEAAVISKVIKGQRPERIKSCHSDKIWSIITRCWAHGPEERPSTEETLKLVLEHDTPSTKETLKLVLERDTPLILLPPQRVMFTNFLCQG